MDDSFIGRDSELAELAGLLQHHRLVTIVGPPGVGKTRLAMEIAKSIGKKFDEAVTVDFSSLTTGDDPARYVAHALSMPEVERRSHADAVAAAIADRTVLLLLDNCEHVAEGVTRLARSIDRECPNAVVLATSRRQLDETENWELAPLDVPVEELTFDTIASSPAVRLFVERARAASPSFDLTDGNAPDVVASCRILDGLPLAIELVAARANLLSPRQLTSMIRDWLGTIATSAKPGTDRHRTLETAISWSWDMLADDERVLLRRLSVFAGGATLAAAESVCKGTSLGPSEIPDLLDSLAQQSLVVADGDRYRLLETIREFAREKLIAAGEPAEARDRHAGWALALAEVAQPHLTGREQLMWLSVLDRERDNLRAALAWTIADEQAVLAVTLAGALTLWWRARGMFGDGRQNLEVALALPGEVPVEARANALWGAGFMGVMQADQSANARLQESLRLAEQNGDTSLEARSLLLLANAADRGDHQAGRLLDDSIGLARRSGDEWCLAHALVIQGRRQLDAGDAESGRTLIEEGLEVSRGAGDLHALTFALVELGQLDFESGRLIASTDELREAARLARELRQPYEEASAITMLAAVQLARGELDEAARLWSVGLSLGHRAGVLGIPVECLRGLSRLALSHREPDRARALLSQAIALTADRGYSASALLLPMAQVALAQHDLVAAESFTTRGLAIAQQGNHDDLARAMLLVGDIARRRGDFTAAEAAQSEALSVTADRGRRTTLLDAVESLAGTYVAQGRDVPAAILFGAAEAKRRELSMVRFAPDSPHYDADMQALASGLPPRQLAEQLAGGAELPLEDAVAEARRQVAKADSLLRPEEAVVARLVAEGLSNVEVARHLCVSDHTVHHRLTRIYTKLGISSRAALTHWVTRNIAMAKEANLGDVIAPPRP